MHFPTLQSLGYADPFRTALGALPGPLAPARVTEEQRGLYRIAGGGAERAARLAGRLHHGAVGVEDLPAVGDWVAIDAGPGEGDVVIRHVLPRRSALIRKAAGRTIRAQVVAANVDAVFVMAALERDFNPRRIERALALVWESGAEPVLVLSKADLCEDVEAALGEASAVALGVPIHPLSALLDEGLAPLGPYLEPGRTVALLGSSGVGKSTLTNRLAGREVLAVQEIRDADGKGRHTTSHRQLVPLPCGANLIDTPGLREVGLWTGDEGVAEAFGDVEALAVGCRFRDCGHESEPGCAVLTALAEGGLDPGRFENYRRLQRELAYMHRKTDQRARLEERKKWTAVIKSARAQSKRRSVDG